MHENVKNIRTALKAGGWMQKPGAYILCDGQYGSTGKGLAASLLAELFHDNVDWVTTNAGPNSGHTSYYKSEKIVLKQLPTFAVIAKRIGKRVPIFLNAGAVINVKRLNVETQMYLDGKHTCGLHPAAVIASPDRVKADADAIAAVGSTGQGMAPAIAAKVMRDPSAVAAHPKYAAQIIKPWQRMTHIPTSTPFIGLVEVSQGFSLGIDRGFYPYVTSRNCDVGQAMSDAGLHPHHYADSMMVLRTFPIRVAGNSGSCYPDQREISWADLGQPEEFTTVTQKVRRVFTWSNLQFIDALRVNRPGHLFLNFLNYLPEAEQGPFMDNVIQTYTDVMGHKPNSVIAGFGPRNEDCVAWPIK